VPQLGGSLLAEEGREGGREEKKEERPALFSLRPPSLSPLSPLSLPRLAVEFFFALPRLAVEFFFARSAPASDEGRERKEGLEERAMDGWSEARREEGRKGLALVDHLLVTRGRYSCA
jgi:hypothetical protein